MINLYNKSIRMEKLYCLKGKGSSPLYFNSYISYNLFDFSYRFIIEIAYIKIRNKIKIYKIFKLTDNDYNEKIITIIKRKLISRSADKYELQNKMRGCLFTDD